MVDELLALSGPRAALAWVGLVSVVIGLTSILVQAVVKPPVRVGPSLAVRTAFVLVFSRIVYRSITGGTVTYWAVLIYAAPGVAMLWALVDAARHHRRQGWHGGT